jgi:Ser/Thr protein kinase RdoA (MazF antagonist)
MTSKQNLSSNPGRVDDERLRRCLAEVACAFGLATPTVVRPLGGTATPKFAVQVPEGQFVVRARPAEFAAERCIRFDHESLWRLAAHGLPVPRPRRRADGTSWFRAGRGVFEVLSWIEGDAFRPGDQASIAALGSFLARFHLVLGDDFPAGKEGVLREDHPDLLAVYVDQLRGLCHTPGEAAQVERLAQQLALVRRSLDQEVYPRLPQAVIHGDIHPGNVRFKGASVAAVYDFDYLSAQARCRDVVDALMFFAANRRQPLNPDDIRSLTQPFVLNLEWCSWLLDGYQQVCRLTDLEWIALPWLVRSQWLQIRLRGSRKVPPEEKLSFVLDGFFDLIVWLEHEAADFFGRLR